MARLLTFALLLVPAACALDICPPSGPARTGLAAELEWRTYTSQVAPERHCTGAEVLNTAATPLPLAWPGAGIERTVVRDRLEIARCCVAGEDAEPVRCAVEYGEPIQTLPAVVFQAERDAESTGVPGRNGVASWENALALRGTLVVEGRALRVDVEVRCSVEGVPGDYLYRFEVANRSADTVTVDWDVPRRMAVVIASQVRKAGRTTTTNFATERGPMPVTGVVELRTRAGRVAGRFLLDGFTSR